MSENITVANPSQQGFTYAPLEIEPRAEPVMNALLSKPPEEIKNIVPHIIDFAALNELSSAIRAWPERTGETLKMLEVIDVEVQRQILRARNRREKVLKSGAFADRRSGEAKQRENDQSWYEHFDKQKSEFERLFHLQRLWEECAVWVDVDTCKSNPEDEAEVQLPDVLKRRKDNGFSEESLFLGKVKDLPDGLERLARQSFGKFFGDTPMAPGLAVSFIRELRFFGHGKAGTAVSDPEFFLTDTERITTGTLLTEQAVKDFRKCWLFMAPGATIAFDGCDVGRGEQGKQFLSVVAFHFFGGFKKWGYLKANQGETQKNIFGELGLDPVDPVTYRWPDDLKDTFKKLVE